MESNMDPRIVDIQINPDDYNEVFMDEKRFIGILVKNIVIYERKSDGSMWIADKKHFDNPFLPLKEDFQLTSSKMKKK